MTAETPIAPSSVTAATDTPGTRGDALHTAAHELLSAGNQLRWSDDHGELELRAGVGQKHAAALPCIQLEHGSTRLRVALEHEPPGNATTGEDANWRDYDNHDARLLAWTLAYEGLIDTLAQVFGNPVIAVGASSEGGRDCLWLSLQYRDASGGGSVEGWIGINAAEAKHLAAMAAWQHDPARPTILGDATSVTLTLWIPGVRLCADDIEKAAPGDVLLACPTPDTPASLRPDRHAAREIFGLPEAWSARHADGRWSIVKAGILTRSDESRRPYFLLPGFTMPLEKAAALQPGSLLADDATLAGATVGIALDDRRFGEGTLVMLGDRLGVRIDHRKDTHGL